MVMRLSSAIVSIFLVSAPALADGPIGYRELAFPASGNARALEVGLWYPAGNGGTATLIADNPAFVGFEVAKDVAAQAGRHPLVILSHGFGGNRNNQAWLAKALAEQGYVVAAANHPGTTTRDMNPAEGAQLWKRPRDISHVIDALFADPDWSGTIDPARIAVIGHSLGAWTAIAIAGGRFDAARLAAECGDHPTLAACAVYDEIGAGGDAAARVALEQDLKDARVKAVVALDIGLVRSFDPASLAAVDRPVLVIAVGARNAGIPAALESGYLAEHLPAGQAQYVEIADAKHFSFLLVCKPGAEKLLEEDEPGDGIICQDGGGRSRPAIHSEVAERVTAFLHAAIGGN